MARRIAERAEWQGGHITAAQLEELGLSRHAIRHRVESGTLIRVHHGVYAVGHLPTTPRDRARGALLAAGPQSALAGAVALAFWRNDRDWPDELELVSARDVRLQTVRVRHAKGLLPRDIRTAQGVSVTSPARTALDLAPDLGQKELTRIINDLRHVNGLKVHQLRDVMTRNPRHPGTKSLRAIVGDAPRQPTRSELENAFRRLIKRHKLPAPEINATVGGEIVDAYFPDHALVVELDGREVTHAEDWRPAFENDRARAVRVMERTGIPTIRFTWNQITKLHHDTAPKLRSILEARQA